MKKKTIFYNTIALIAVVGFLLAFTPKKGNLCLYQRAEPDADDCPYVTQVHLPGTQLTVNDALILQTPCGSETFVNPEDCDNTYRITVE